MTTEQTRSGLDPQARGAARMKLRIAVMYLGGGAAAQRRNLQLGHLRRSWETIEEAAGQLDTLKGSGVLEETEAEAIASVGETLGEIRSSSEDFLHERDSAPREFLWSDALTEPYWDDLRHRARAAFSALRDRGVSGVGGLGSSPASDRWLGTERAPGASVA